MKLRPFLLIPILLLSFACSSDDSNDNNDGDNQNGVLIKQINYSAADEDFSNTETFNYSENRLISIVESDSDSNDEYNTTFAYDNDKLVRVEFLDLNELVEYVTLDYNADGLLTNFTTFLFDVDGENVATNSTITYDNSNISLELNRGDFSSQTEFIGNIEYVIVNGNILETSSDISDDTESYQYDTKNSAFKNIFDMETIILIMDTSENGLEIYGATNNVTQRTDVQSNFPYMETTGYTYNESDYPNTAMYYIDGELEDNIEFIYE